MSFWYLKLCQMFEKMVRNWMKCLPFGYIGLCMPNFCRHLFFFVWGCRAQLRLLLLQTEVSRAEKCDWMPQAWAQGWRVKSHGLYNVVLCVCTASPVVQTSVCENCPGFDQLCLPGVVLWYKTVNLGLYPLGLFCKKVPVRNYMCSRS